MEAYPLQWPMDRPRTSTGKQKNSRFITTLAKARDYVKEEIGRLKAKDLIISTNLPVNRDGELRADSQRFKVLDPGVAIYFVREGKTLCLADDLYTTVHDNLYAIGRTIEALRQIDRDGVSDFLNRSFQGFTALPAPAAIDVWNILNLVKKPSTKEDLITAYKVQSKKVHPDVPGGSTKAFQQLQEAYDKALKMFD